MAAEQRNAARNAPATHRRLRGGHVLRHAAVQLRAIRLQLLHGGTRVPGLLRGEAARELLQLRRGRRAQKERTDATSCLKAFSRCARYAASSAAASSCACRKRAVLAAGDGGARKRRESERANPRARGWRLSRPARRAARPPKPLSAAAACAHARPARAGTQRAPRKASRRVPALRMGSTTARGRAGGSCVADGTRGARRAGRKCCSGAWRTAAGPQRGAAVLLRRASAHPCALCSQPPSPRARRPAAC